jgi:O-antigen/teichoic acid export membrane protein
MAKSIKKNFLYNLAFQIVSICLPIVLAPYLARVLGAEKVGISAFTLSVVEYFILLANLGISSFGQREVAMYQDNRAKYSKIFWDLIVYRVIIGSVSLIAYGFFVLTATQYQAIYAILVINLLGNIFHVTWLFQGLEEYKYLSVRNIIIKIAFTILVFILVKTPADLNLYVFLNGLSILVSAAAVWVKIPSTIDKIELKKVRPLRYTKDTFIFFLPQIATMVYTVLDRTMLGLFDTTQIENGYYEQAYKIVFVATTAIISMNVVMSPRMSFLYKKGKIAELKTRLRK